jgi:hypothetical protein
MKLTTQLAVKYIGIALGITGIILLFLHSWKVGLGVFFAIWGHNAEKH